MLHWFRELHHEQNSLNAMIAICCDVMLQIREHRIRDGEELAETLRPKRVQMHIPLGILRALELFVWALARI